MIDQTVIPETLNVKFSHLKTWDEVIAYGGQLRETEDQYKWELGDLAAYTCKPTVQGGRPKSGDEEYTVAAFAKGINETRSVVSELMHNAEFWTDSDRANLPANASWRQAADARRRSGWQTGTPITFDHKLRAMTILNLAVDQKAQRGKPSDKELLAADITRCLNSLYAMEKHTTGKDKQTVIDLHIFVEQKLARLKE